MNPEDLYALYRERQSDRRFADRPVPQEVLERILNNALLAPSATNQQPWSIVAVSEPETAQRVGQAVIKGVTNYCCPIKVRKGTSRGLNRRIEAVELSDFAFQAPLVK